MTPSLPERLQNLSPAKKALLDRMLAERNRGLPPVVRRDATGPAPLSFAQQRLWFLQQVEPHNPFYNVAAAVRLRGTLQADVLEKAIREIIRRHEILRTRFHATDGEPVQIVNQQSTWRLAYSDLAALADDQREAAANKIAATEADRPFDFAGESLILARLVRLEPDHHLLVLVLHHIICDGWSMNLIRRELTQLYAAFAAGQPSPLPDLELQYSDYAAWQRRWLPGSFDQHLQFWGPQLAGSPGVVELPYDFPRTDQPSFGGASVARKISAELTRNLERCAAAERGTLFMGLLAAWQMLLARYTDQTDICVGTPIANRRAAELEPLVGLFVNTLPVRTVLAGNPTFRELLARVRETCLQADAHQDLPLEKLVEELQPCRDWQQTPLFNTLFVLQDVPRSSVDAGELRVTEIDLSIGQRTHYDLTLNVTPIAGELEFLLVYRTEMFARQTIERWLANYETLLAAAVDNPDRPLAELPLLSADERQQVMVQWNRTATEFPSDKCLHELVSQRARKARAEVAVECAGERLSYGELEQRANQLAHYLRARGAAPDDPIGILLPRSTDTIVAMLSVLKAGAAYLVCDPAYPPARVTYMLRDAQVGLMITQRSLAEAFNLEASRSVVLDTEARHIAASIASAPTGAVSPDDLAYLVYTSGSSGDPKAVEVPHRGLVNHAIHLAERMAIGLGDRQIQNLSLNFDASSEEIFPTLIAGGTVVVNPAPADMTAAQLLEFCQQHRVDILHVVAPMWHQLVEVLEQQGPQLFAGLKTVVTGADAISPAALATWCLHLGARLRMLFIYGVTEATITTTIYDVPAEFTAGQRVPIGKPIANHRVYVLDRHFQPVPIGAVGELFIGGVGVARGYRNRSELSASRFVDDPFDDVPGSRMYRTGDRARWRFDGNLEFLGRVDEQLKVRGYRVEPGEIESVLSALETVAVARVTAWQDQAGRRLVAYVVPAASQSPTPAELRSAVAARLPQHLVPAAFVLLEELPLLPGGKVDTSALPAPEWLTAPSDRPPVAPRTDAEAVLAKIWADLLHVEQVSIEANFFELGGDSILSLQVIGRARAAGLELTPKQLLQHQTIAALAAVAQPAPASAAQAMVTGKSPLSPIQHQFFAADLAQPDYFNQGVLLRVNAPIALDVIEQAWTAVVEHHDVLSCRFVKENGRWQQCFTGQPNGADHVSRIDLAAIGDVDLPAEIEKLGQRIQAGLDLEHGPVATAAYLDLGERRGARLLPAIHHLAVDGVSWRILIEDLHNACRQLLSKAPVSLPPKTTSFKTWAERLHELARDPRLHEQAAYWLQMADAQPLPVDLMVVKPVENRVADVDEIVHALTAVDTHALLTDVHLAYRTRIDEVLLAALAQTLCDWSGTRYFRIDCERHGRDHPFDDIDVSRTVGWFTCGVPVAITVPKQNEPQQAAALLCAVKEQLRAVPQYGMGYGLARWLAPDGALRENMARLSPAQISFNYLGQLEGAAADDGLFSLATEPIGPLSHEDNHRWHLLEFIAHIQNGQLHVKLLFNRRCHNRETMQSLLDGFANHLGELIGHCLDPTSGQFTPSDFPLADVDQEDLATLTQLLNDHESDGRR